MNLYQFALTTHNINRWLVLIMAFTAIINAVIGINQQQFRKKDALINTIFLSICHLQLILGLILYSLSPVVTHAFEIGIKEAMQNDELRFYTIEHVLFMFIAIMLVHVGCALSKKQLTPLLKHQKTLFFFSIALLLILLRIPWQRVLWPI